MKKITKPQLIKKGKEVLGDINKFNMWLNTECEELGCKPMEFYARGKLDALYKILEKL